jgi:hypothetical protein
MRSLKVAHEAKESAERSRAACEEASQATVIAAEGAAADALKAQEASLTAQNRASDAFTSSFTGMQSVLSLSEKITTFARDAASKVLDNWSSLSTQVSATMIVHGSEVHEYMQSVTKSLNSSQGLIKNIEGAAVQHEVLAGAAQDAADRASAACAQVEALREGMVGQVEPVQVRWRCCNMCVCLVGRDITFFFFFCLLSWW